MDFYPLEFCSIMTPTELQKATCTNYEEFLLVNFSSFFIVPVGLVLHTSYVFSPSLVSVCLRLISHYFLCAFWNTSYFFKRKNNFLALKNKLYECLIPEVPHVIFFSSTCTSIAFFNCLAVLCKIYCSYGYCPVTSFLGIVNLIINSHHNLN